ncbi:hypothetical protein SMC4_05540 [Candidatus Cryosericum hinesii]|jgi:hypothetical protein|nr:hypothetical protein SMC4_05540 [Candidatus Cryosericum hinesii]
MNGQLSNRPYSGSYRSVRTMRALIEFVHDPVRAGDRRLPDMHVRQILGGFKRCPLNSNPISVRLTSVNWTVHLSIPTITASEPTL